MTREKVDFSFNEEFKSPVHSESKSQENNKKSQDNNSEENKEDEKQE